MGNTHSQAYSTCLTCFKARAGYQKTALKQIEAERQEGRAMLRTMVEASEHVDWQAVIAKANELHTREQELMRQCKGKQQLRDFRFFGKRLAAQHKRRLEGLGSFSVNMLAYRGPTEESSTKNDHRSMTRSSKSMGSEEDVSIESRGLSSLPDTQGARRD